MGYGYRCPIMNSSLGNSIPYSAHAFGRAHDALGKTACDEVIENPGRYAQIAALAVLLDCPISTLKQCGFFEPYPGGRRYNYRDNRINGYKPWPPDDHTCIDDEIDGITITGIDALHNNKTSRRGVCSTCPETNHFVYWEHTTDGNPSSICNVIPHPIYDMSYEIKKYKELPNPRIPLPNCYQGALTMVEALCIARGWAHVNPYPPVTWGFGDGIDQYDDGRIYSGPCPSCPSQ